MTEEEKKLLEQQDEAPAQPTISNVDWLRKYGYVDEDKEKLRQNYLAGIPDVETEEETERKIKARKTARSVEGFTKLIGALGNVFNVNAGAVNQTITPQTQPIDYDAIREKYRNARNAVKQYKAKAEEYVQSILDKRAAQARQAAGVAQGQERLIEQARHNGAMEYLQAQRAAQEAENKRQEREYKNRQLDEQKNYHKQSISARYATINHRNGTDKQTEFYDPSTGTTYNIPSHRYKDAIDQLAAVGGIPLTKEVVTKDAMRDKDGKEVLPAERKVIARTQKEIVSDIIKQLPNNPDLRDELEHLAEVGSVDKKAAEEYNRRHASSDYTSASRYGKMSGRAVYPLVNKDTGKTEYFNSEEERQKRKAEIRNGSKTSTAKPAAVKVNTTKTNDKGKGKTTEANSTGTGNFNFNNLGKLKKQ